MTFNELKATQVAAFFLELAGTPLHYVKLLKLMYLADRTMLTRHGRPITFDKWVAMKHGPVLSSTYDLIKYPKSGYWHQHLTTEGYEVRLKERPGFEDLSPAERAVLEEVFAAHGHLSEWRLRDLTHTLDEWSDPGPTSRPITYREVLEVEGFSQEDIEAVLENIETYDALERLIARR